MFSAATGESLKDIKDRLNIRKRGTNARTAAKEKTRVVTTPSASLKPHVAPEPPASNAPVCDPGPILVWAESESTDVWYLLRWSLCGAGVLCLSQGSARGRD